MHERERRSLVAAATSATAEVVLLEGANHYVDARREQLARCIVGWLRWRVASIGG
jgi:hypothetical protein